QLRQVKKMGSLTDIVAMIPGMSKMADAKVDDKQLTRVEAILSSMTIKERKLPKIIDGNRRRRISIGSGTTLQEVNQVLKQFEQMQKMMKQFSGMAGKMGGMRQMQKMMQKGGKMPGM
ncbi:MAG: signal recognition particle protein, partial [Fibrobacteres bacterium]|nr:signal recognition particle protein [Fibrobacterota bacterium]